MKIYLGKLLFLFILTLIFSAALPSSAKAVGSVVIDGGAAYTTSRDVTLYINFPSTTFKLDIQEAGGPVVSIGPELNPAFHLSDGDGVKIIKITAYYTYAYAACCGAVDAWGNCLSPCTKTETRTEEYTSSIILDGTKPGGAMKINGGAAYTNSTKVTLDLNAWDNILLSGMRFKNPSGEWSLAEDYGVSKSWDLPSGDGYKTVYSQFVDAAGNWSDEISSGILLDTTPPLSSIFAFVWKEVKAAFAAAWIAVSPDYANDHTVFVKAPDSGLLKTDDGGDSWSLSGMVLPPGSKTGLVFSPDYASDQTLFIGTDGGIYKSTDGGTTWTPAGVLPGPSLVIAISPAYKIDKTLFAGTAGAGLFKSSDGGASWNPANSGMDILYVSAIGVSPAFASDKTIFASGAAADGSGPGFFKSIDGGWDWSRISSGIENLSITSIAVSPRFKDDGTVYIGTGAGVFCSTDGGKTWSRRSMGLTGSKVLALAISPCYAADSTLFAGLPESVFKSRGDAIFINGSSFAITGHASDGDGSGIKSVEVSTDGGSTWNGGTDCSGGSWKTWSYIYKTPADGAYSLRSRATDNAGNIETAGTGITALVDNTAPSSRISFPASGAEMSGVAAIISGSAGDGTGLGVKKIQLYLPAGPGYEWVDAKDGSGDGSWSAWSYSWTLPADGNYSIRSRAIDYVDNMETPLTGINVTVDNTKPASSITSPKDGALINGIELKISGTAKDSGSGIERVQVLVPDGAGYKWVDAKDNSGGSWSGWSLSVTMPADGNYRIQSRATDNAGNVETSGAWVNIVVDNTKPEGLVVINGGASSTKQASVFLSFTCNDLNGVAAMKVANTQSMDIVPWENFALSREWTLNPGDGTKTVFAQFKDAAGNESNKVQSTILLDTVSPAVNIDPPARSILYGPSYEIHGTASDEAGGSGLDSIELSFGDGAWTRASGKETWSYPWTLPIGGTYTVSARATDKAGNASKINSTTIDVENTSPVATAPPDNSIRPAGYTMPPQFPDPPEFKWAANACEKFKIYFSKTPDFHKSLAFISDGGGVTAVFKPTKAIWSRITRLGSVIFWKAAGIGPYKKQLCSRAQTLFLDGGYSDIKENASTDVSNIPVMKCDPGNSSIISVQFSSEPYFITPITSPPLRYGPVIPYNPGRGIWSKITKLGPAFYWRFTGRLSTGERTFSKTSVTCVTGGPDQPIVSSGLHPLTITWGPKDFVSFGIQASADSDFTGKLILLGVSKTGSFEIAGSALKKITTLGSPVYIRISGRTAEKYTAYGPAAEILNP